MIREMCIPIQNDLDQLEAFLGDSPNSGIEIADSVFELMIKNGGKRIRPIIFLLSARLCGSRSSEIYRVAAAIEMIHAASLLHDDVVDDASMRRGFKNARTRFGNRSSIAVGDYLWSKAMDMIIREKDIELLNAASSAVERLARGQLLEISNGNNADITVDTYMKIVEGKTASLFAMSAEMGALIGGIKDDQRYALYKYGLELGRAYQLSDDLLDYVGGESVLGKSAGQDFQSGTLTYPLILTLQRAGDGDRNIITEGLLSNGPSSDLFLEICGIIDKYGGVASTKELISDICLSAKEDIGGFRPSVERDSLIGLADLTLKGTQ